MPETQVFVKVDNYKDVLRAVGLIKDKINEAKITLGKIKELKQQEDSELEEWDGKLSGVESKIVEIDQILFEPSL